MQLASLPVVIHRRFNCMLDNIIIFKGNLLLQSKAKKKRLMRDGDLFSICNFLRTTDTLSKVDALHSFGKSPTHNEMTVHSLHIFDRKGKTLFTKRYTPSSSTSADDVEQLSEQRKLIFGMLFSLRELMGSLTPEGETPGEIHCHNRSTCSTLMRIHLVPNSHAYSLK